MSERPARYVVASFLVLLAIQLLTSLVAIALLGRMSPAIERILEENVASVEATEHMLAVLALPEPDEADRRAFMHALSVAIDNVTEIEEREPLQLLQKVGPAAVQGDPAAKKRAVQALLELGRINRQAAKRADDEAKRLGTAGAWSVALLGLIGMVASVFSLDRTRKRILAPVTEMAEVVHAYQEGDVHRRCTDLPMASEETRRVMLTVNQLLDEVEARRLRGVYEDRLGG